MNVYECIAAVSEEIAKTGISKDRKNSQQGYSFRGIDDVYNSLAPILAKHKLVVIPRVLSRECVERASAKGGALFYVTVEAEYDFISARDGSKATVRTYGEAMDSADKATNKAMSAAYKYAAFQTFCIPTEGDNDADANHHEVAVKGKADPKSKVPEKYVEWVLDLNAVADEGRAHLQKAVADAPKELREYLTQKDRNTWQALWNRAGKAKEMVTA